MLWLVHASKSAALLCSGNILVDRDSNICDSILSWMGGASLWRQNVTRAEGEQIIPNSYWDLIHFSHHPSKVWTPMKIHQIKSRPAENLELDGACRCARQWLQRNNITFWPRLRRRHEDEVLVFNAQLAQVLRVGLDRKLSVGARSDWKRFPHVSTILGKLQQYGIPTKHSVWWSSRAFMGSNRTETSWGCLDFCSRPLETRRKPRNWWQSKPDVRDPEFVRATLRMLGERCPRWTCQVFLLDGMVFFSILFHRVLISIAHHWQTLPAQVTNYSSQCNCSANIVAFWLARFNSWMRVNGMCGGPEIKHVQDVGTSK